MGIIERRQRVKDLTRINILEAAMNIVRAEGWAALSMRKIAEEIEYSSPVIYEYFSSKEDLLTELTKLGHLKLNKIMSEAVSREIAAEQQMESAWFAYWNFAFTEKEYYRLMFGVGTACCDPGLKSPETGMLYQLIKEILIKLWEGKYPDEQPIQSKFYAYWAMIHGLVAINLLNQGGSDSMNRDILSKEIEAITHSLHIQSAPHI